MADLRSVTIVVLIVLLGTSVGALAGYRLYVQQVVLPDTEPILVDVTIEWPDGGNVSTEVPLVGMDQNAYGALRYAVASLNITMRVQHYRDDAYVWSIGGHDAEGDCGWVYSVNGAGVAFQPTNAANKEFLENGDRVYWSWGCV
ncbi:MAG: DUF4430 domain-containing protein [Euryarchaeota archaeon]|nr:DUF4430 domain-containing protein [Euryarchaeota archaeon]